MEGNCQSFPNEQTNHIKECRIRVTVFSVDVHLCSIIDVGVHVVDDGFHVVAGLLQFPHPLIGAGFVLKGGGDEDPVDGFSTACSVFK